MCLDFKELKVPCVRSNFTLKLYRDDERNGVDHLQKKRHLKYLLPNVPLKQTNTDILSALSFTNNRKSSTAPIRLLTLVCHATQPLNPSPQTDRSINVCP